MVSPFSSKCRLCLTPSHIYGPRLPSHEDTPKAYRMATVVVSDRPLMPVELTYHDRQAEWFGSDNNSIHTSAAATGFRATMDT